VADRHGKRFKGTFSLYRKELNLFAPGEERRTDGMLTIRDLDDPLLDERLGGQAAELRNDMALLEGASNPFVPQEYLEGSQTPVFFGSAINNFGVREMLDAFVEIAPSPMPRATTTRVVSPDEEAFSGFVFKIQANMDPRTRPDRLPSHLLGPFPAGDEGASSPDRQGRLPRQSDHLHGAGPDARGGGVAGRHHRLHNHGTIRIGDTFSENEPLKFVGIPNFAPEHFRRVRVASAIGSKHLKKGLAQLSEEGTVQLFRPLLGNEIILGAVGVLQFDVTLARLKAEYNVDVIDESVDFATARWVNLPRPERLEAFRKANQENLALDAEGNLAYLAASEWRLEFVMEKWPEIAFLKTREHD